MEIFENFEQNFQVIILSTENEQSIHIFYLLTYK